MTLAHNAAAHLPEVAVVRTMTAEDVRFAAALHSTALPHGFFARLGLDFLVRYYESFVGSPKAIALVAEGGHGPAGMLVGTVGAGHFRWVVRRHGWRLLARGMQALLARPREFLFFMRTRVLWYLSLGARMAAKGARGDQGQGQSVPVTAVLLHIAVAPEARGTGAGAALVDSFLQVAQERGCHDAMLVTLAGRAGAGRFYRRLGWTLRDLRRNRDGRLQECYERRL